MIYDVIDNVLPQEFNNTVIETLRSTPRWQIAGTEHGSNNEEETGIVLNSFLNGYDKVDEFENGKRDDLKTPLNTLGLAIANTVLGKHQGKFIGAVPKRFFWNRYPRNGMCKPHQDYGGRMNDGEHLVSLVYHLNDNDGYNIINGERIETVGGRCIIFQSTDWHEAHGPFEFKERFTFNAVLGYYNYERG